MTIFEIFTVLIALVILTIQKLTIDRLRKNEKEFWIETEKTEMVLNQFEQKLACFEVGMEIRLKKKLKKMRDRMDRETIKLIEIRVNFNKLLSRLDFFHSKHITKGQAPLEEIHSIFKEQIERELDPKNPHTEYGKEVQEQTKTRDKMYAIAKLEATKTGKQRTRENALFQYNQTLADARKRIIKFYTFDSPVPANHLISREKQIEEFVQAISKMIPKIRERERKFPDAPRMNLEKIKSLVEKIEPK